MTKVKSKTFASVNRLLPKTTVKGYRALAVALTELQPSPSSPCCYIYFKQHSSNDSKTLFVLLGKRTGQAFEEELLSKIQSEGATEEFIECPYLDAETEGLKNIFSQCGEIESISFGSLKLSEKETNLAKFFSDEFEECKVNGGVLHAHITFSEEKSLKKALRLPKSPAPYPAFPKPKMRGLSRWVSLYIDQHPNELVLESAADEWMKKYDLEEKEKLERLDREAEEVDEDGFVKVSKRKKRKGVGARVDGIQVAVASHITAEEIKQKFDQTLKSDFYRFQKAEQAQKKLQELRDKFEEDKKRINEMKEKRKFKPY